MSVRPPLLVPITGKHPELTLMTAYSLRFISSLFFLMFFLFINLFFYCHYNSETVMFCYVQLTDRLGNCHAVVSLIHHLTNACFSQLSARLKPRLEHGRASTNNANLIPILKKIAGDQSWKYSGFACGTFLQDHFVFLCTHLSETLVVSALLFNLYFLKTAPTHSFYHYLHICGL